MSSTFGRASGIIRAVRAVLGVIVASAALAAVPGALADAPAPIPVVPQEVIDGLKEIEGSLGAVHATDADLEDEMQKIDLKLFHLLEKFPQVFGLDFQPVYGDLKNLDTILDHVALVKTKGDLVDDLKRARGALDDLDKKLDAARKAAKDAATLKDIQGAQARLGEMRSALQELIAEAVKLKGGDEAKLSDEMRAGMKKRARELAAVKLSTLRFFFPRVLGTPFGRLYAALEALDDLFDRVYEDKDNAGKHLEKAKKALAEFRSGLEKENGNHPPAVTLIKATFNEKTKTTTYEAQAIDADAGDKVVFVKWSNSVKCGTFEYKGATATWKHPHGKGGCTEPQHRSTITVELTDGHYVCTAAYELGAAPSSVENPKTDCARR